MIRITRGSFKTTTDIIYNKVTVFDEDDPDFRHQISIRTILDENGKKWGRPIIETPTYLRIGNTIEEQKRWMNLLKLVIEEAEKIQLEHKMEELSSLEYGAAITAVPEQEVPLNHMALAYNKSRYEEVRQLWHN